MIDQITNQTPISTHEYHEQAGKGSIYRQVELYPNNGQLPKGWNGIERIIKVRRWGTRQGKTFDNLSYFVLSKPINSATVIAQAIQQHWTIENNLHWVKDVLIKEDFMTLQLKNTVALLAYLNNAALNFLRLAGHKPTKDTFAKFTNKVKELYKLFYS